MAIAHLIKLIELNLNKNHYKTICSNFTAHNLEPQVSNIIMTS